MTRATLRTLAGALCLGLGGLAAGEPTRLAITNVTLIDATGAPPRANATVLVEAERIALVGPASEVAIPAGARVIEGRGRFLIPGLQDMHVHLATRPEPALAETLILPLLIVHGVTGVRDMGGDWERVQALRRQSGGAARPRPAIVAPGPFLDGPQPPDPSVISAADAAEARAAVRSLQQRGVDFVKVQAALSREAFLAAADEARSLGIPLAGHAPEAVNALEASGAGQRSLEHVSPALPGDAGLLLACSGREAELRRELLDIRAAQARDGAPAEAIRGRNRALQAALLDSYDPARASAVFAQLARNGTFVVPTLIWSQSFRPLSATDTGDDLPLRYLPAAMRERWTAGRQRYLAGVSAEELALSSRTALRSLALVGELHRAGVRLLAGTDSFDAFVLPGDSLHRELELLVRAGLSPLAALQAATREAAAFLGRSATAGSVEAGKAADLVLLDADPLIDIRNTRRIAAVVRSGRYLSRADLDAWLGELESAGRGASGPAAPASSASIARTAPASRSAQSP